MGILVESSALLGNNTNVYCSARFEPINLAQDIDGTYTLSTSVKVYPSSNSVYAIQRIGVNLQKIPKEELSNSIHSIIYSYLKSNVFPGATDAL